MSALNISIQRDLYGCGLGSAGEWVPPVASDEIFFASLRSSAIPEVGTASYHFTRNDADATVEDYRGKVFIARANEIRFEGARRERNFAVPLKDFPTKIIPGGVEVNYNVTGPSGAMTGVNIVDAVGGGNVVVFYSSYVPLEPGNVGSQRLAVRLNSRSGDGGFLAYDGATAGSLTIQFSELPVNEWVVIGNLFTTVGTTKVIGFGILPDTGATYDIDVADLAAYEDFPERLGEAPPEYVLAGAAQGPQFNSNPGISSALSYSADSIFTFANPGVAFSTTLTSVKYMSMVPSVVDTVEGDLVEVRVYLRDVDLSAAVAPRVEVYGGFYAPFDLYTSPTDIENAVIGGTPLTTFGRVDNSAGNPSVWVGVSVGSGTFSGVIDRIEVRKMDNGCNEDGVQYFEKTNGNTTQVLNAAGVLEVIEGEGTQIQPGVLKGYLSEDQSYNWCDTWNDLSTPETIAGLGVSSSYTVSVKGTAQIKVEAAGGLVAPELPATASEGNPVSFTPTTAGDITLTLLSGTIDTAIDGMYLKQVEPNPFATSFIPSPGTSSSLRAADHLWYDASDYVGECSISSRYVDVPGSLTAVTAEGIVSYEDVTSGQNEIRMVTTIATKTRVRSKVNGVNVYVGGIEGPTGSNIVTSVVFNGDFRIYQNRALTYSNSTVTTNPVPDEADITDFSIGGWTNVTTWQAGNKNIKQVRVWDRALTEAEAEAVV